MRYTGLSLNEVKNLREKYGLNVLPVKKISPAKIFVSQFKNPLVYILVFVGIISLVFREYYEVIFIFSVVILNSIFGFFQEYKAEKTLTLLREMVKPRAKVIRQGKQSEIDASELIPDDIIILREGNKIPADGVILESASFFVNEAILTGESEAITKEKNSEVFMGTIAASGRAVMKVVKIGLKTKMGEIASGLLKLVEPQTPLQIRLRKLTRTLIYVILSASFFILFAGVILGKDFWEMFRMAAVLTVAVIPEAMPIAVTLILVIGMQRILKRKSLVRKLLTVETLGSVTTICADKTGTLTEGLMKVSKTDFINPQFALYTMCLCNDLSDPLEVALWDYLEKQKKFYPQETFDKYSRVFEIPFGSEHKFMATANCLSLEKIIPEEKCFLLVKGAPEILVKMSALPKEKEEAILEKIEKWGSGGLKILGFAFAEISRDNLKKIHIKNMPALKWAGIAGLWDPPRQEVKEALSSIKKAGVKVKVVTGDYRHTAEKIMEFLGMKVIGDEILEGHELEKLNDEELKRRALKTILFTRITPHQKLRIVDALQNFGEIVAMTGDGVNDTLALKKADMGIVVESSVEVAKETADLVLLDSNFKTIVSAVEEGRTVFENIKKVIFFMLSDSFAEVTTILGAIIFGWPLPLTILQILWIHLLCDGPEDVVLGFEPKEKEIMLEGPKKINEPILDKTRIFLIFALSFLMGFTSLLLFWYFGIYQGNIALGQTLVFMNISIDSIFYIFSCRSFRKPFWKYENFWSNKYLFATVIFGLILQSSVTYIPFTRNLLNLVPLNLFHWLLILSITTFTVFFIEIIKIWSLKIKNKKILD